MAAAIPDDWTEKDVTDLLLWPRPTIQGRNWPAWKIPRAITAARNCSAGGRAKRRGEANCRYRLGSDASLLKNFSTYSSTVSSITGKSKGGPSAPLWDCVEACTKTFGSVLSAMNLIVGLPVPTLDMGPFQTSIVTLKSLVGCPNLALPPVRSEHFGGDFLKCGEHNVVSV